jgi:protoheme IX farnesyltransferase
VEAPQVGKRLPAVIPAPVREREAARGPDDAPTAAGDAANGRRTVASVAGAYVALMKPRIIVLLLITTLAAMVLAQGGWPPTGLVLLTMLGGFLAAGGANAINQYLDRDIDELMRRTRGRPLPAHRVAPAAALRFGVALGVASFLLFALFVNLLSAFLAITGLLVYVVVYTLWLKRATPQNIVIGGAAGAIPPLVGWAAVTGALDLLPLYLFAIVFFWTPPHFWALSLLLKRDYADARVPMLPVVEGEAETKRQILLYSLLLIAVSLLPFAARTLGGWYLAAALALGAALVAGAVRLLRGDERTWARRLFLFSNAYLALLFLAMIVDRVVIRGGGGAVP